MKLERPSPVKKALESLREHLRVPLFANAYALITDQVATSALGFLYWILAARLYSVDVVGENSAILSTVFFIVSFSELSLKSAMARFIPRAGNKTARLVIYAFGVSLLVSLLFGIFLFTLGRNFSLTANLLENIQLQPGWLIFFGMAWTVFFVEDGVLTGLRRAKWVVAKNFTHSALKAILLFFMVETATKYGLVISWFLPAPFIVLGIAILIFSRFIPEHLKLDTAQTKEVHRSELFTSVAGDHVGTIIAEACGTILPLLVLQILGKEQTAYFYQVWVIYAALSTIPVRMSSSFAVESSLNMVNIIPLSRRILKQMLRLMIPVVIILTVVGPFALLLFGQNYLENGSSLLRWMILSVLPYMVNNWFLSYSRVLNRVWSIIFVQSTQFTVTLGVTYILLPRLGIAGVGIAWLAAQCVIAIFVLIKMTPKLFKNTAENQANV